MQLYPVAQRLILSIHMHNLKFSFGFTEETVCWGDHIKINSNANQILKTAAKCHSSIFQP